MTIDVLCRVVDNFGDIGFAYRLVRALSETSAAPVPVSNRVRLVVDDLDSFAQLCPRVDPRSPFQTIDGILVVRWDDPGEEAIRPFLDERPRVALELYACGRPDWFEAILFDELDPVPRLVVDVEYLTAEPWAADFHKLPSLTRSPLVRKSIFMPGFIPGTGGLLEDAAFRSLLDENATPTGRLAIRNRLANTLEPALAPMNALWVTVFSYERDFTRIVADLAGTQRPVLALVAAGRGAGPFFDAWNRAGKPFPARALPMLAQTDWDALLVASDFSIVRGEESFARAILAGNPFLWQCYPFGTGGQLPKVQAFLDVMARYVEPDAFAAYERTTLAFNENGCAADLAPLFRHRAALFSGFSAFSRDVRKLGNLADNLLTFLRESGYTS